MDMGEWYVAACLRMIAIRSHAVSASALTPGLVLLSLVVGISLACTRSDQAASGTHNNGSPRESAGPGPATSPRNRPAGVKVIRAVVALCDNLHQGIVPVPARLGNGDDPDTNLYWGAGFGVKTFFSRSPEWRLIQQVSNPRPGILRRCIFQYTRGDVYLIADAYQGIEIRRGTVDFLEYAAGALPDILNLPSQGHDIALDGPADLIVYVGHDGLMDFKLPQYPQSRNASNRDAMVMCCASKAYFASAIRASGARPLLLTTGLMAPEAYVLEAAIKGWISGESGDQICSRAATAYNKYQKCGYRAARGLFTTGS